MTGTPLVSILMPAFNVAPYIAEAIESVLRQTHTNWELLVADDYSTDATTLVIERYDEPRIRRLPNSSHLGYLRTTNRLFALARGQFITFQDADDFSAPTRLEKQLQALLENPGLGLCGTWVGLVDERGRAFTTQQKPVSENEIREAISRTNPFCGASLMVQEAVLRAVGGYREFFVDFSHQDYDWAYRTVERFPAVNVAEVLYFYRQRRGSNSKLTNPRRSLGYRLAQEFAAQRRQSGSDDLMRGDLDEARRLVERLFRPYVADPSLGFREAAGQLLASHMYVEAQLACARAIRAEPNRILNYRTFLYCARRWARHAAEDLWRRSRGTGD